MIYYALVLMIILVHWALVNMRLASDSRTIINIIALAGFTILVLHFVFGFAGQHAVRFPHY